MYEKRINYLSEFITPERLALFERLLDQRIKYLTVVLENIYQAQNASAVLRSVDCFGVQDVYVVENDNRFEVDREVAMGASKWLNVKKFNKQENNSLEAVKCLRKKGYRIVATTPHKGDVSLEDFDLAKGKSALFFGTELTGISDVIKEEADEFLKIPTYGFTESLNISVSAAIIVHYLTHQLRSRSDIDWKLTAEERAEIKLAWLRRTIKTSELIEEQFDIKNKLK
ncbi:TrmH family RNA methyltransferase [Gaoshiqia sp. Z1-71]|uniref:TrmH family RNA methyltransferase n=1 Tax=Gaoshiqia hydrogeniformans TaxID=3290090 RepID=UPI003BF8862A